MKDDLISRQAVKDLIMENDPWWCEGMTRTIFDGIDRLPSIDAVPARHGCWSEHKDYPGIAWLCTECGHFTTMRTYHYCPNCGARMDEERKEE